jgi:adenylosuccinate synthase
MIERLLLLSGAVAAGKSAVAKALKANHGFSGISTSRHLKEICAKAGLEGTRQELQDLGDRLDDETGFRWVVDNAAFPSFESEPTVKYWFLDAVRKEPQVHHFRQRFGLAIRHIHLTAPEAVLLARYTGDDRPGSTAADYAKASRHPNELHARSLSALADRIFDTSVDSVSDIVEWVGTAWRYNNA